MAVFPEVQITSIYCSWDCSTTNSSGQSASLISVATEVIPSNINSAEKTRIQLVNNLSFLVIHPTKIRGPKSPKSETFTDGSVFLSNFFSLPKLRLDSYNQGPSRNSWFCQWCFWKTIFYSFINFLMAHISKTAKNFDYNQNQFIVSL